MSLFNPSLRPLSTPTDSDEDDDDEDDEEHVGMDSLHNLDSHYSDTTASHSTTSTATAIHLNPNPGGGGGGPNNAGDCGGGGGGSSLQPPRSMANRRTSLADIISRVRRTSAGLQANNPLQPLTESKSELPHYSVPGEKFADKRVKVKLDVASVGGLPSHPIPGQTTWLLLMRWFLPVLVGDYQNVGLWVSYLLLTFAAAQHPRNDGGGGRTKAAPRNGIVVTGREKVPAGRRTRRCGQLKAVRYLISSTLCL